MTTLELSPENNELLDVIARNLLTYHALDPIERIQLARRALIRAKQPVTRDHLLGVANLTENDVVKFDGLYRVELDLALEGTLKERAKFSPTLVECADHAALCFFRYQLEKKKRTNKGNA